MKVEFRKTPALILLICFFAASVQAQETTTLIQKQQAISFKPINYSNINLGKSSDVLPLLQFGLAYERLFQKGGHWAWEIPVTYARMVGWMADYSRHGNEFYITPGLKYYLKANSAGSGWSASFNTLFGFSKYDYSTKIESGHVEESFCGLLGNWIYNAAIGKNATLSLEFGAGIRYTRRQEDYRQHEDFLRTGLHADKKGFSGIMNVSLGFSKWF